MSVTLDAKGGVIILEGHCALEESEALLGLLMLSDRPSVDWRTCTGLHAAVLQLLLAVRPTITGPAASPFLERHIAPILHSPPVKGLSSQALLGDIPENGSEGVNERPHRR